MGKPQALITGGSRGIGKAICLELAKQGFDIAFTYRSQKNAADALQKELQSLGSHAKGYSVDMANAAEFTQTLEKILEEFTGIEALVNNAGISLDGLALRYKLEDFDKILNTNVRAAWLASQAVLRPMMKNRKGCILFMSSVIGQMGNAGQAPYATTKAALFGMAKSLAKEVGSRGIRVNVITPGFIKTDMTENLPAQNKEGILAQIPLGTFGEAEDIAKTVAFLVSQSARYITGQVIAVNGGLYM